MKLQSPQVYITKTPKKFPSVEGWQAKTDGVVSGVVSTVLTFSKNHPALKGTPPQEGN